MYVTYSFRGDSLPLIVEMGHYTKPKVPLNDRKCIYCFNECVEDEMHFLIKCDFYSDLRYYLFQKARSLDESFMDMNDEDKFIF